MSKLTLDDHGHVNGRTLATAKPLMGQTELLNLPNELLLKIFDNLRSTELYNLALSCRRLNCLVLPIYLHRHVLHRSSMIYLEPGRFPIIPPVIVSPPFVSCKVLSSMFYNRGFFSDIRRLQYFVTKILDIKEVRLDFVAVSSRTLLKHSDNIRTLLADVMAKSCESLVVAHDFLNPFDHQVKGPPRWRNILSTISRPFSALAVRASTNAGLHSRTGSLNKFEVHSTMLVLPPFLDWTVKILNTSPITTLSLGSTRLPFNAWANLLSAVTLPSLEEFSITNYWYNMTSTATVENLAVPTLLEFLSRHPSITRFQCHGLSDPSTTKEREKVILPLLESIDGNPEYIIYFLRRPLSFPKLHHVAIFQEADSFDCAVLDRAISVVGRCAQDITLRISLPPNSPDVRCWMNGPGNPQYLLQCAKKLELQVEPSFPPFSDCTKALFPAWLARFPSLRHVEFIQGALLIVNRYCKVAFVRSLDQACPMLETVTLDMEERDVSTWLTMCTY